MMSRTEAGGNVIQEALSDAYYDISKLFVVNVLWFLLSLPIVTIPPALAGLYYATHELACQRETTWETFFEGFRTYFWLGWRWFLVYVIVLATLVMNQWFYGNFQGEWASIVQGIFLGLIILWLLVQVYTFPLLLEQEDRRVWVSLRNSLVLYLKQPGLSLGLVVIIVIISILSTLLILPWIILSGSLIAFLQNRTTIYLVEKI